MKNKILLVLIMVLLPVSAFALEAGNGAITINTEVILNTFKPYNIFGNNTSGWANPVNVKERIQEAGNYLLRYPGGSWGDSFFWNSSGSNDADSNWVTSVEIKRTCDDIREPKAVRYAGQTTLNAICTTKKAWQLHRSGQIPGLD